jgi:protein SCO1/2
LAAGSIIPGILLAFFPKCAVCWAAYFSVFSSMGIGIPYSPWLQHVLAGTLVISAIYFAWMAKRRNKWLPFIFQMMGFAAVLISQYAIDLPSLLWVGVGFVFIGSLLYAMPHAWMQKLEKRFKPKQYSSYTS